MFNKYPHFKARGAQALKEILDWTTGRDGKPLGRGHDPVEILPAEDGSGVGAALIAALTLKRVQEGKVMGIRDPEGMLKGTVCSCRSVCLGGAGTDDCSYRPRRIRRTSKSLLRLRNKIDAEIEHTGFDSASDSGQDSG